MFILIEICPKGRKPHSQKYAKAQM